MERIEADSQGSSATSLEQVLNGMVKHSCFFIFISSSSSSSLSILLLLSFLGLVDTLPLIGLVEKDSLGSGKEGEEGPNLESDLSKRGEEDEEKEGRMGVEGAVDGRLVDDENEEGENDSLVEVFFFDGRGRAGRAMKEERDDIML